MLLLQLSLGLDRRHRCHCCRGIRIPDCVSALSLVSLILLVADSALAVFDLKPACCTGSAKRLAGLVRQMVVRIALEKFFEYQLGLGRVFEIILINLADGEQRIETVAAAGIFAAQKLVLADG